MGRSMIQVSGIYMPLNVDTQSVEGESVFMPEKTAGAEEEQKEFSCQSCGDTMVHRIHGLVQLYLRLWALSLAHSQLAAVCWQKALTATIEMDSLIFILVVIYEVNRSNTIIQ